MIWNLAYDILMHFCSLCLLLAVCLLIYAVTLGADWYLERREEWKQRKRWQEQAKEARKKATDNTRDNEP